MWWDVARQTASRTRAGEQREQTPFSSGGADESKLRANREQTPLGASKPPLGPETVRQHLETLLPVIQLGARLGLTARLPGVNPVRVQRLLLEGSAQTTDAGWEQACRGAGPVTTLAACVDLYHGLLDLAEGAGEDVFTHRAALDLALAHVPAQAPVEAMP